MLVELKKLNIINEGYKRKIFSDKIFVNSNHVISIRDYQGASDFLISEGPGYYNGEKFSLLRVNSGSEIEEIIVYGSSSEIYAAFSQPTGKRLLND